MFLRQVVELPLDIERTNRFAVFKIDNPTSVRVARNVAGALHRIGQDKISRQSAVFQKRKNASRRTDFQGGGDRVQVRVADEQMQAPILPVIGQRFIPRVDDGAIELHPLIDVVHDVIGALAQLKIDLRLLRRRLKIKRQRIGLANTAGAGEDLSRCQKGEQRSKNRRRELRLSFHQVILVATKSGAGVMINVVLDKGDAAGCPQGGERRLEQLVTVQPLGNEIAQMQ